MSESFKQLFEQSMAGIQLYSGAIIPATIINIEHDFVLLNANLKSEGMIPIEEFKKWVTVFEISGSFKPTMISI